jgi:hypothetical protein
LVYFLYKVPSTVNEVHEHFLEDIIKLTNFNKFLIESGDSSAIDRWITSFNELNSVNESFTANMNNFDELLFDSWSQKSPEGLNRIINLIKSNKLNGKLFLMIIFQF